MNNKRILIVGVLAVIVTLMVGYALFSETITINGTATAKGDFSITASCQTGIPTKYTEAIEYFEKKGSEGGYFDDTCTANGNVVVMNTTLNYPEVNRWFTVEIKNTGSIASTLESSNYNGKFCYDNNDDGVAEKCNTLSDDHVIDRGEMYFITENGTTILLPDGEPDLENESLKKYLDEDGTLSILPDCSILLTYRYRWPSTYTNSNLYTMQDTITYNFKQITN